MKHLLLILIMIFCQMAGSASSWPSKGEREACMATYELELQRLLRGSVLGATAYQRVAMKNSGPVCEKYLQLKILKKFFGFDESEPILKQIYERPQCFKKMLLPYFGPFGAFAHKKITNDSRVIYDGPAHSNKVALTFDDGPSLNLDFMPKVLDVLSEHNVQATFFVLGARLQTEEAQALVRRAHLEGHEIQLHGWDQSRRITKIDNNELIVQIEASKNLILNATGELSGEKQWMFRPPWGATNKRTTDLLVSTGHKVIMASGYYGQFNLKTRRTEEPTNYMVPRAKRALKSGAIQVFHVGENNGSGERVWDSPCTAITLPHIIKAARDKGYELVTLTEMLQ